MISLRDLTRALARRNVADWTVIERSQELAISDTTGTNLRTEQRTITTFIVHHDTTKGRGTAQITVVASDVAIEALVEEAVSLAVAAVGPTWKSVPPAAPAKVGVLDPSLAKADLNEIAATIASGFRAPSGSTVAVNVTVMREHIAVQAKSGFRDASTASELRADALVTMGAHSLEVVREARRADALGLEAAVAAAVTDLRELARATAPSAIEECTLVLATDAMLHQDGLGVWSVFAAQADSALERQGLSRYRLGTPIAPGAEQVVEPLTISSDGAIDFALRSARVGEDGDSIRKFPLVNRGVAAGLALSMREAALRGRDPNGGIRNLIVAPGTWNGASVGRTIEVLRLRALSIDERTGDASLELALAVDRNGPATTTFTGGSIRLDLVAELARARRSATTVRRGAYVGPTSVMIERVALIV